MTRKTMHTSEEHISSKGITNTQVNLMTAVDINNYTNPYPDYITHKSIVYMQILHETLDEKCELWSYSR